MSVRRVAAALAIAMALFVGARDASAVRESELVQRAHVAAARDDWNQAARALGELVDAGIDSSDVLYDLGTVYAHAGRFGEAIWRFEEIVRRSPFAFDAQQNLRATRLRLAHRDAGRSGRAVVETALPFRIWLGELLPIDWSVALALLAEAGIVACVIAARRKRSSEIARVAGIAGAVLLTGSWLVLGAITSARATAPSAGIVLHEGVRLLHDPAADAIPETGVREGERLELLSRESTFVRVRTVGGIEGWLASRDLGPLDE